MGTETTDDKGASSEPESEDKSGQETPPAETPPPSQEEHKEGHKEGSDSGNGLSEVAERLKAIEQKLGEQPPEAKEGNPSELKGLEDRLKNIEEKLTPPKPDEEPKEKAPKEHWWYRGSKPPKGFK